MTPFEIHTRDLERHRIIMFLDWLNKNTVVKIMDPGDGEYTDIDFMTEYILDKYFDESEAED